MTGATLRLLAAAASVVTVLAVVAPVLTLGGGPAAAAAANTGGCQEITGPTNINQSGCYRLSGGVTDYNDSAFIVITASNVTLDGNGTTLDGTGAPGQHAVFVDGVNQRRSNVTVRNFTATEWGAAVYVENASGARLADLTVRDSVNSSVTLSRTSGSVVTRTVVENVSSTPGIGIAVRRSDTATVVDNTVRDAGTGIAVRGSGSEVRNNTVERNRVGLRVTGPEHVVSANRVRNSTGDAAVLGGAPSDGPYTVRDNVFRNNTGGVTLYASGTAFTGNRLVDTGTGSGNGSVTVVEATAATVANNSVSGAHDGIRLFGANGTTVRANALGNLAGTGLVVVSGNGSVVDAALRENVLNGTDGPAVLLSGARRVLVANTTANRTAAGVLLFESGNVTVRDTTLREVTGTAYRSENDTAPHRVDRFTVGPTRAVSFEGLNVTLRPVFEPPPDPVGGVNVDQYLRANRTTPTAYLDLAVPYTDAAVEGLNESTIRLWRYDAGTREWTRLTDASSVDTAANVVRANLSTFSVFAPMADDPRPVLRAAVNRTDGTPARGDGLIAANVTGTERYDTRTDDTGEAAVGVDANTTYDVGYFQLNATEDRPVVDGSPDYFVLDRVRVNTSDVDLNTTRLPPASNVTVTVANESGTPVANATVRYLHRPSYASNTTFGPFVRTASDGQIPFNDGRLELNGSVTVRVRPPDSGGYVSRTYTRNLTVDGTRNVTVRLNETGPRVSGRVNTSGGTAAVNDSIGLRRLDMGETFGTTTNAEGRFAVRVAENATYDVRYQQVNASGDAPALDDSPDLFVLDRVRVGTTDVSLGDRTLPTGYNVTVTVVNESGTAVGNASVSFAHRPSYATNTSVRATVTTAPDGQVPFEGGVVELNGSVRVQVRPPAADGYVQREYVRNLTVDGSRNVTVRLNESRPTLAGQVNTSDGTPAVDDAIGVRNRTTGETLGASTGTDGTFSLRVPENGTYDVAYRQVNGTDDAPVLDDSPDLFLLDRVRVGTTDVTIPPTRLPTGYNVTVTVVNESGTTVENATVRYLHRPSYAPNASLGLTLPTGSDGRVPFNGGVLELNGSVDVVVRPPASDEYVQREYVRNLTVSGARSPTVRLNETRPQVSGRVNTSDGTAADNDSIGLRRLDTRETFATLTDREGRFSLRVDENATYDVAYRQVNASGGGPVVDGSPDLFVLDRVRVGSGDVSLGGRTLPPASNVTVTVVNESGATVANASVAFAHRPSYAANTSLLGRVRTAPDGQVPFDGGAIELNGSVDVVVRPPASDEYVQQSYVRNLTVAGARNVTVRLNETRPRLAGRINTSDGTAADNDSVVVRRLASATEVGNVTPTDSEGRFAVRVAENTTYEVSYYQQNATGEAPIPDGSPDYFVLDRVRVNASDVDLRAQLPTGYNVTVTVVNESGTAVENATVRYRHRPSYASNTTAGPTLRTSPDGQIPFASGALELNGSVDVVVRPPATDEYVQQSYVRNLTVTADEGVTVRLNETQPTLSGRINVSGGGAADNDTVVVRNVASGNRTGTLTDTDGSFSLRVRENATYDVGYVQQNASGDAPVLDGSPDLFVLDRVRVGSGDVSLGNRTLPAASNVTVTVVNESGVPVANASVRYRHRPSYAPNSTVGATATTASDGQVPFEGGVVELNGSVTVRVLPPRDGRFVSETYVRNLTVDGARNVTVRLNETQPTLSGQVNRSDGSAAAGDSIAVRSLDTGETLAATTDSAGRFSLRVPKNATYDVGYQQVNASGDAPALDDSPDLFLLDRVRVGGRNVSLPPRTLPTGYNVSVTVVNESGTAVGNASVVFAHRPSYAPNTSLRAGVTTAPDGQVPFDGGVVELNGSVDVVVRPPATDEYVQQPYVRNLTVTADEGVTVRLNETQPTLRGRLNTSDGTLADNDSIVVRSLATGNRTGTPTDAEGRFAVDLRENTTYDVAYYQQNATGARPLVDGSPDYFVLDRVAVGSDDVTLRTQLPTGYNVTVTVLNETGSPVANASVAVAHRPAYAPNATVGPVVPTAPDGQVPFNDGRLELNGSVTVRVTPPAADGYVQREYVRNLTVDGARNVTVRLNETRSTVGGDVATARERAAANDTVVVRDVATGATFPTATDDAGEFVVVVDHNATYDVGYRQHGSDGRPVLDGSPDLFVLDRVRVGTGDARLGTRTLPPADNLTVTVVDESGTPVANATLAVAHRPSYAPNATVGATFTTDADGQVPFNDGVLELDGSVTVRVRPPDSDRFVQRTYTRNRTVDSPRRVTVALAEPGPPTAIASCRVIDSNGTYVLASDVTNDSGGTCLAVTASNVTLDGRGHTVDVGGDGTAVNVTSPGSIRNVTVRNVTVANATTGVAVDADGSDATADVTVTDVRVADTGRGVAVSATGNRSTVSLRLAGNRMRNVGDGIAVTADGVGASLDLVVADNDLSTTAAAIDSVTADSPGQRVAVVLRDNVVRADDEGINDLEVGGDDATATVTIARNEFTTGYEGIDALYAFGDDASVDVSVRDNTFTVDDYGIDYIELDGANQTVDVDVVNNTVEATDDGIYEVSANGDNSTVDVDVRDNTIRAGDSGIEYVEAYGDDTTANVSVVGNDIEADTDDGIYDVEVDGDRSRIDLTIRDNAVDAASGGIENLDADGDNKTVDVAVVNNTIDAGDDGIYEVSAQGQNTTLDIDLRDNVVRAGESGVEYVEVPGYGTRGDVAIVGNDITALTDDGIYTLQVDGGPGRTNLTVSDNVITAANGGIENILASGGGDESITTTDGGSASSGTDSGSGGVAVTVVRNRVTGFADVGLTVEDVRSIAADRPAVVVRRNDFHGNGTSADGLRIDRPTSSGASAGTVVVEYNDVRANGSAVVVGSGPVAGIRIEGNDLAGGTYGVRNLNTTNGSYVNATGNYWAAGDGPASAGPYADPVTGTLANGSGSNVTNVTADTANVHFDPFLSREPAPGLVPTVTSTNSPVTVGQTVAVTATVENRDAGVGTVTRTVRLRVDGQQRDAATLTLAPGERETVTLRWDTAAGDAGSHVATVLTRTASSNTTVRVTSPDDDEETDDGSTSDGDTSDGTSGGSSGSSGNETNSTNTTTTNTTNTTNASGTPDIAVSPTGVEFGTVLVDESGQATVTVENVGDGNLSVSGFELGGDAPGQFGVDGGSFTLAPNESRTVTVTFAPGRAGNATATLSVSSDDPDESTVTVSLSGAAEGRPSAAVSPSTVDFGSVPVGVTANATVTVRNDGTAPLAVSGVTLGGSTPGAFTVEGGSFVVAPNESQTIPVAFAPADPAEATATLSVATNDSEGAREVGLRGTGVESDLLVRPGSVEFGAVRVGGNATATVTLVNNGSAPAEVTGVRVDGADSEQFGVRDAPEGLVLAGGESRQVTVVFAPRTGGPATAQLAVANNDSSAPLSVRMTGTGQAPAVALSASALRFGNVTLNSTTTRSVTVRNRGNATLTVRSVSVVGPDSGAFSVDAGGFSLEPNGSRQLTVTFEPQETGGASAQLRLRTDDPERPQVDVWLTNTDTVVETEARTTGNQTSVNASIRNVSAGEEVSVNVSQPSAEDEAFSVDEVGVTVERDGNLSVNLTTSDAPLDTTPDEDLPNASEPVGYLRVNASVPDDGIAGANVTFEVDRATLEDTDADPEDVTLYRYSNGTWNELETSAVRATNSSVVVTARLPDGFSEFAASAKQPDIELAEADVGLSAVTVGDTVDIRVRITNKGGADGTFTAELLLNDEVVETRRVTVAASGTRQIVFERTFEQPGDYQIRVNNVSVGSVTVEAENVSVDENENATVTAAEGTAVTTETTSAFGPGFDAGLAVVALLAVALWARLRRPG